MLETVRPSLLETYFCRGTGELVDFFGTPPARLWSRDPPGERDVCLPDVATSLLLAVQT